MAAPEVGVLLPVRLETRFVRPERGQRWLLRVRVIPDAVSITNHDDVPSAFELDRVEQMWRAVGSGNLESAAGRSAFRLLAATFGPERAAWLARTFPPTAGPSGTITVNRPATVRQDMRAPKLMGLPPTMEIWMARGNAAPRREAVLSVLVADVGLDLDKPDGTTQPWWSSFTEAVRVGMAAEIDLGTQVPNDIDALYVVGIGAGDPGPLLSAHVESGRLAVVPPGAATNTVDGAATIESGDADTWRRLAVRKASTQGGAASLATSILGTVASVRPGALPAIVGGDDDHQSLNRAVVGAIWPAMWGHSLANVWGDGAFADRLGVWAAENLVPEGPVPSMRVMDTPYGILPVTSLKTWKRGAGDPSVEQRLVPLVAALVDDWAGRAAQRQAIPDELGDLVHNPHATRYAWRWMLPTTLTRAMAFRFAQPLDTAAIDGWWTQANRGIARLDPTAAPARKLVATGWSHDVGLDLVDATDLAPGVDTSAALATLATAPMGDLLAHGPVESDRRAAPPWGTSLLTELGRHSLVASAATVAREVAAQPRALVEPIAVDRSVPTAMETWAGRLRPPDLTRKNPAVTVHRNVREGLRALAGEKPEAVDRALRAALDTATHRLDPWATAIAWRRLQSLAAAPRNLGVYGWVDAPRPDLSDRAKRFVLAPSREQAIVAAMLRDRAERDPGGASPWMIDLTSDAVRDALQLAEDTRTASHPAESLGRTVERIIRRPDVIDKVRAKYPLVPMVLRADLRLRRVCNGVTVLEAAMTNPTELEQLGVRKAQISALVRLSAAVDALADLHVAEAALGVVRQRPSSVETATKSAAGQASPPEFNVVSTPRSGKAIETVVAFVLPVPAIGNIPTTPAYLADPAVAAFLDDRGGNPQGQLWTWRTLDASGRRVGSVSLSDAALRPSDTVGLGIAQIRAILTSASGAIALDAVDPSGHAIVRAWAAAIGGVPAEVGDVRTSSASTGPPDISAAAFAAADAQAAAAALTELTGRYAALLAAAIADAGSLRSATTTTVTDASKHDALAAAARWGITPFATAGDTGTELTDRVVHAADAIELRIAAAPTVTTGLSLNAVAEAIAALLSPESGWPVFGRLDVENFTGRIEPTSGSSVRLDPDWIETVAPVRPAVGRLEAVQLGERVASGGRPLRSWSNQRGDPWQTSALAAAPGRQPRLVAVFGPKDALPALPSPTAVGTTKPSVAVAIIDRFGETIPSTEHTSSVAFPHDLPNARAQQAVLLAVPPAVDLDLTPAVLMDIVVETRALTRARMLVPQDLGASGGSLHLAAMPAAGRSGVQFGGGA